MKEKSNLSACRRQWGWGNDAQGESPFGPSPELGNRSAIPTFPHPRRLLHSFKIQTRKGIIPRRLPPSLQAHSSIGKGCVKQFSYGPPPNAPRSEPAPPKLPDIPPLLQHLSLL